MAESSSTTRVSIEEIVRADLEARIGASEAALTEHWDPNRAADYALQSVGTKVAFELIDLAMKIAWECYVLGTADGDGKGGMYSVHLTEAIIAAMDSPR